MQGLTKDEASWLPPDACERLLASAESICPHSETAATPAEAAVAALRIGFPVAVKLVSSRFPHKSEVQGVVLNLVTADAVQEVCTSLTKLLGSAVEGFLIQRMVRDGLEVLVGVVDDATFGPLVGFGLGGTTAEVLNDVVFRITPLTDVDVHEMVRR